MMERNEDYERLKNIYEAVGLIRQGKARRVDLGNIIVYRVKNVIRIDIKGENEDD